MYQPDLLDSFLTDAWDALARFQAVSKDLDARPREAQIDLKILAHRLRGTAALYGFKQVAGMAELSERVVAQLDRVPTSELAKVQDVLAQISALLHDALVRVARAQPEGDLAAELQRLGGAALLQDVLKAAAERTQAVQPKLSPETLSSETDPTAAADTVEQDASDQSYQTSSDQTSSVQTSTDPGSLSLTDTLRQFRADNDDTWSFFLPEALEHIDSIYKALNDAKQETGRAEALTTLFRATHTLKGAAYMVNLVPVGDLAHELEDLMSALRSDELAFTPQVGATLRAGASSLNLMLRVAEGETADLGGALTATRLQLNELLGREEALTIIAEQAAARETARDTLADSCADTVALELNAFRENNPDIWDYFAPELNDNLATIDGCFEVLNETGDESDEPDDKPDEDPLYTLYRAFHTLKGSPAMVGFPYMSEVAARLESLTSSVRAGERTFAELAPLFAQGRDTLAEMLRAAEGEGLVVAASINRLNAELDALTGVITAPLEVTLAPRPAAYQATETAPKTLTPRTIRVGLNKLETLMDVAGELVTSRTRLDLLLNNFSLLSEQLESGRTRLDRTVADFSERHINPDFQGKSAGADKDASSLNLKERFAELEFDTYSDLNILARSVIEMSGDLAEVQAEVEALGSSLNLEMETVRKLTRTLRTDVGRARMVPIGTLFSRLSRLLDEHNEDKAFRLVVKGETVEIDNTVVEGIADAMLHLVKNALVHGIETRSERAALGKPEVGLISLSARQQGNAVIVEVEDDGRGIDANALKIKAREKDLISRDAVAGLDDEAALELVFLPGLSTAAAVTQSAGRGVGMDAVKTDVTALKGDVSIVSTLGKGSRFSLRLPLTLLITEALLMQVGTYRLAFPAYAVKGLRNLPADALVRTGGKTYLPFEGRNAQFVDLRELFGVPVSAGSFKVVFVMSGSDTLAFATDSFLTFEDVVVKGLSGFAARLEHLAGATVDSRGVVVPLYDPAGLFELARAGQDLAQNVTAVSSSSRGRVLLVDDSLSVRKMLGAILTRAGYEVVTAVDGQDALDEMRKTSFMAVLTDLEMPRINGYELMEEVRRGAGPLELPVIVMTTRAASKHMELAFELGANDYLSKPVEENRLLSSLAKALSFASETVGLVA